MSPFVLQAKRGDAATIRQDVWMTINSNWCRLGCHCIVSCSSAHDFAASAADFAAAADFPDAAVPSSAVDKVATFAGDIRRLQVRPFVAAEVGAAHRGFVAVALTAPAEASTVLGSWIIEGRSHRRPALFDPHSELILPPRIAYSTLLVS